MKLATLSLACLLTAALAGAGVPSQAPAAQEPATPAPTNAPPTTPAAPDAYRPGDGVKAPRLLKEVKPTYPPSAMGSGITGTVTLECVVLPDGGCSSIRVVKALDSAPLMDEAMRALKQWRFIPGEKDGKPVPVIVTIEMSFSLASKGPVLDSTEVARPGPGVTLPKVEREVKPAYPEDVRFAGVHGTVQMECIVLADGTVGQVRVTKGLDPSLDAEATKALKQWKFKPGTRDGKAVPVQTTVEMSFEVR